MYHWFLLLGGFGSSIFWGYLNAEQIPNYFLLCVSLPVFIKLALVVWKNKEPKKLNNSLRDLSLFSLAYTIAMGFLMSF